MTWCPHCAKNRETARDYNTGHVCCVECGKVISQDIYSEEATFVKDSSGGAHLAGNFVRIEGACSESRRRTLEKGNTVIYQLMDRYGIAQVDHATRFYEIAVDRNFTKGRRTAQVAAACLYVACREKEKPFLLIEFSSELGVSVYELGTVYLQLCKLLSLQDHDFIQKPIDPSLFMHRYTNGLIKGDGIKKVTATAVHLVASMKRDWMQTGRKPSGICAAALYVSSLLHGYNFSRADVVKVVHICEATLTKRLIEFENTKAGSLTIEEFTQHAEEFENEMKSCKKDKVLMPGSTEVLCNHAGKAVQSGFGLCKSCYLEFCGGLDGLEPPAFQRAEMERLAKESQEIASKSASALEPHEEINGSENENRLNGEATTNLKGNLPERQHACLPSGKSDTANNITDPLESAEDVPASVDETDTLNDIDDFEVSNYIHTAEESQCKRVIWESLNKDYVQVINFFPQLTSKEQAAKKAAAEAALKHFTGTPEEREAMALSAAAKEAVASKRQKDRRKRALEAKNAKPAQTPAEAAGQVLTKKRLSSKINYEALNSLFDDEPTPKANETDDGNATEKEVGKGEKKTENSTVDEGGVLEDDYVDEGDGQDWEYGNEQEMYSYDEDYAGNEADVDFF